MFNISGGYNSGLLFIVFFLAVVLISMVYYTNKDKNKLRNEINNLNKNIDELKDENQNKLDELNSEMLTSDDINISECPDCNCPENKECPVCPETTCPTVDDIISGIFPGRNTGITSSGRYFNVQGNESYELFPDYDFYQPSDAFPNDSILNAPQNLLTGTMNVPGNQINNTYDNNMLLTQNDSMVDSRMMRGQMGVNTGPTSFGQGTDIYSGDIASETNRIDRLTESARLESDRDPDTNNTLNIDPAEIAEREDTDIIRRNELEDQNNP